MTFQPSLLFALMLAIVAPVSVISYDKCQNIATFNTGLLLDIDARLPRIIQALKTSTADAVCLQEVWFERDMEPLLRGVRHVFPHHFSKLHAAKDVLREADCLDTVRFKDTPCNCAEGFNLTSAFIQCAINKGCLFLTGLERQLCFIMDCSSVMRDTTAREECVACVFLERTRVGGIADAIKACSTPTTSVDNRLNSVGLVLLSREKLSKVAYTSFFPSNRTLLERGYIEATLEDGKKIVCAHLTANLSIYVEYELDFAGYEEQSKAEVMILGSTFADIEHILVGDINIGPRVTGESNPEKNLQGDYVENYELLVDEFGYLSPFLEQDGRCTYCNGNPLQQDEPSNLIDVVMVVNGSSFVTPSVQRLFDPDSIPEPLSDHYGVQVRVCEADD